MDHNELRNELRAYIAMMRELGCATLRVDGIELVLGPQPFRYAAGAPNAGVKKPSHISEEGAEAHAKAHAAMGLVPLDDMRPEDVALWSSPCEPDPPAEKKLPTEPPKPIVNVDPQ